SAGRHRANGRWSPVQCDQLLDSLVLRSSERVGRPSAIVDDEKKRTSAPSIRNDRQRADAAQSSGLGYNRSAISVAEALAERARIDTGDGKDVFKGETFAVEIGNQLAQHCNR